MNDILIYIASILSGYLIGSISFSRVVTALVSPGTDLVGTQAQVEGTDQSLTMNAVSATSVRIKLGPKYGLLSSFLDIAKVALVVGAFRYFYPNSPAVIFAAIGGVIGHNWPLYYKFRGGYGQSAIYGALLVIDWTGIPANFIGTAIFYFIFRQQVHPASIAGCWSSSPGSGSEAMTAMDCCLPPFPPPYTSSGICPIIRNSVRL